MSFVEQEDVFKVVEKLMVNLFKNFHQIKYLSINFQEYLTKAMLKYGTDKPDLRNPLDNSRYYKFIFKRDVNSIFLKASNKFRIVQRYCSKETKDKPRSFFDNIDKWAKEQGASGLAYLHF